MAERKPLVLAPDPANNGDGSVMLQRLQSGDELDIPLADRVSSLERKHRALVVYLVQIGIEIPEEFLV